MAEKVHLRDAGGRAFSVDAPDAEEALASGEFRRATEEEITEHARKKAATTGGSKALALGEGVVRGATFGLGTAALAEGLGEEYRQNALDRAKHNRGLSVGGEIAGTVLPALFTGGAGAAGTVARLAPATLAGKVAMGAERLASAGTRAAGLTGGGLASSAARGAIRSGVGGAAETALYGLGSSLADSALEGTDWTAERALSGMVDGSLFGAGAGAALGAGAAVGKHLAKAAAREVVNTMAGGAHTFRRAVENWAESSGSKAIAGKGADDARDLIRRLTDDGASPERMQRIARRFEEAGIDTGSRAEVAAVARGEAVRSSARHSQIASELGARGVAPDVAAIRGPIQETIERLSRSDVPDAAAAAKRLQSLAKMKPGSLIEAEALATKLEGTLNWARDTKAVALPELERLSSKINGHLDELAASAGDDVAGAWREARQSASDWRALSSRLGKEPLTDSEIGKMIGLAGSAASIMTGSVVPFVASAVVSQNPAVRQFARERGGQALAWLASRAGGAEKAVAESARRLASLSSPFDDAADAVAGAVKRGKKRRGVVESTQTYGASEDHGARYAALAGWLMQTQQDPKALASHISATVQPIAAEQPEVASAMAMRMVADHAYLASKLPPGPDPSTFITKSGPPLVSRLDQRRILRYASALNDPPATLRGLAEGKINWEGADALKTRRPLLWEGFRMRTLMAVAKREEPLPYKRRVYLSVLFDTTLDPSLEPGAVKPPATTEAPGQSSPVAMSKVNPEKIGGAMATPAQAAGM